MRWASLKLLPKKKDQGLGSLTMAFIHPLQSCISNKSGDLVVVVIKSSILAFKAANDQYSLVGRWTDDLASNEAKNLEKPESLNPAKKLKDNEGQAVKKEESPALTSAFSLQVRNLSFTPDESKLIACVDSDKSVVVFEIGDDGGKEGSNCLKLIKRQPFPKRPNAVAVAEDSDTLVIADKFGDVHQMSIKQPGLLKSEDMEPILGHVSMLTGISLAKSSEGQKLIITSDRDEHIKVSHYPQCFIVNKWLFGHKEFVTSFCIPHWNSRWLFSAGGDDKIFSWDWETGVNLSQFAYNDLIKPYLTDAHLAADRFQNEKRDVIEYAVSEVITCETLPLLVFHVEATKLLVVLSICPKSGALALKQSIQFPHNIVSVSESHDEFYVTLDTHSSQDEDFVKFVTYNKESQEFEIDVAKSKAFDKTLISTLKDDESVKLDEKDLYPLYGIIALKKHGEHYS